MLHVCKKKRTLYCISLKVSLTKQPENVEKKIVHFLVTGNILQCPTQIMTQQFITK